MPYRSTEVSHRAYLDMLFRGTFWLLFVNMLSFLPRLCKSLPVKTPYKCTPPSSVNHIHPSTQLINLKSSQEQVTYKVLPIVFQDSIRQARSLSFHLLIHSFTHSLIHSSFSQSAIQQILRCVWELISLEKLKSRGCECA